MKYYNFLKISRKSSGVMDYSFTLKVVQQKFEVAENEKLKVSTLLCIERFEKEEKLVQ